MNTPKTFTKVLSEGIVVGLLLIPFTYITGWVFSFLLKKPMLPDVCKNWNKYRVMEINLLLAGILFHLVFEYTGLNKWYVDNYYSNEGFVSYGLRESCEDILCPNTKCYTARTNEEGTEIRDYTQFRKCKEKCLEEREEDINQCCTRLCPEGTEDCLESCTTPMTYL